MNEVIAMKTRHRARFLLLFAFTATLGFTLAPVLAEEGGTVISLDRARELAVASSGELERLGLSVDASAIAERMKLYDALPSLSASGSAGLSYSERAQSFSDSFSASVGVSASVNLWDGGKNAIERKIAALSTSIAREEARAAYDSVVNTADKAYYGLLVAEAKVKAAEDDAANARQALALAKEKKASGMSTIIDVLQKEASDREKETSLYLARGDLSVARARFASITGLSGAFTLEDVDFSEYEELIAVLGAYDDADAESLIAALIAKARASRPSLAKASLGAESAKKSVYLAKAGYFPSISASAGPSLGISANGTAPSASVSLRASVPLDAWATKAASDSKKKAAEQAAISLEESIKDAELEVRSAAYSCLSRARSVASSAKAYEYAASFHEKSLELYSLSASSSSDLSDAELVLSNSRKGLIDARYGFLEALSDLRALCSYATDGEIRSALKSKGMP